MVSVVFLNLTVTKDVNCDIAQSHIFSIGHGNRKIGDFLNTIKSFGIRYVIDVRSQPYSKFSPHFHQTDLKYSLEQNGLTYVFMGDSLGGRPQDPSCFDDEGKVDYEKVKSKDFFLKGVERLITAYNNNFPIAVMCSESKPGGSHRSKLIGRVLAKEKIHLLHIDEKDNLRTQADVINELNKGLTDETLFPKEITINNTSRKSYLSSTK